MTHKRPDYVSRMQIIIVVTHIKVHYGELNLKYSENIVIFK